MIPGDTLLLCLVLCLGLGLLTHAATGRGSRAQRLPSTHPVSQSSHPVRLAEPAVGSGSPCMASSTRYVCAAGYSAHYCRSPDGGHTAQTSPGLDGVPAPAPTISVSPGPVVPWNQSVRIWCRGPVSFLYHLELQRSPGSDPEVVGHTLGARKEAEFPLQRMDAGKAGSYRCRFQGPDGWSEHSEELQLVVTGFYDKPLLSPGGPLVARLGARLSLRCSSPHARFDGFSLAKEGGPPSPPQSGTRGGYFSLGPVGTSSSGNYSCYGWFHGSRSVWSEPSEALQLGVTDAGGGAHAVENSVRLGLAGLVLAGLVGLLAWHPWGPREPRPACMEAAGTAGRVDLPPPPPGDHATLKQKWQGSRTAGFIPGTTVNRS